MMGTIVAATALQSPCTTPGPCAPTSMGACHPLCQLRHSFDGCAHGETVVLSDPPPPSDLITRSTCQAGTVCACVPACGRSLVVPVQMCVGDDAIFMGVYETVVFRH